MRKPIRVGVGIMAHPRRADYVTELVDSLDAPATVTWDEKGDRWDTGYRTVAAFADQPDLTHWLCLQDDSVPCRDLVAGVALAVKRAPRNPLSLFYSKGSNEAHSRTNRLANSVDMPTFLTFAGPWWGVAVVFPTFLIPQMLRIANRPRESRAYDRRLSGALVKMGVECHYVLPSLVDHRIDGPSMIEGREQDGRVAHHFIGKDASALDIDWANIPIVDGRPIVRGQALRRPRPTPRRMVRR